MVSNVSEDITLESQLPVCDMTV